MREKKKKKRKRERKKESESEEGEGNKWLDEVKYFNLVSDTRDEKEGN